jgi:hypothetical protein
MKRRYNPLAIPSGKFSNAARMNGEAPKIEIFNPFGEAFERTKKMLFRPFDFKKWLVMGFAAFIAGHSGGVGFGNFNPEAFKANSYRANSRLHFLQVETWATAIIVVAVIVVLLALFLVLTWVISRGRFVFADCVVKDRAAIVEPWREFRREGNSYFLFALAVAFGSILVFGSLISLVFLPGFVARGRFALGVGSGIGLGCIVLLWLVAGVFIGIVSVFMVPVMYRQRCVAMEAFPQVARLFLNHPWPFILLILFTIVLFLALIIIGTIVTCATCCIGGLPYVNSVLLLPLYVCFVGFRFFFLRQFGNEFDVWNGVLPFAIPPPPLPPMPA